MYISFLIVLHIHINYLKIDILFIVIHRQLWNIEEDM